MAGQKRALLLGSQGFILSYLCKELLDNDYSVVGIDNYSKYGFVSREHDGHKNFKLTKLDLERSCADLELLYQYDYNFDFIVHGAAKIGGIQYFHKYAYDLVASNERITDNVLTSLIQWKNEHKNRVFPKFVYLSSSMVYENCEKFPSPENAINDYPPPRSSYGFQKLMGEIWVRAAHEQYSLPYTIIRPFNAVGIGEEDDFTKIKNGESCSLSHVLPDFVYKALIKQNPFKILGNGEQVRCLTNAADIARGIRLAMESDNAVGEAFNISNPLPTTVFSLAKKVWEYINGSLHDFNPEYVEGFRDDVKFRVPCVKKAFDKLGFQANISLEDSIKEVTDFIKTRIEVN